MARHVIPHGSARTLLGLALGAALALAPPDALGWPGFSVLDYNVNGIGAAGTDSREALQRIVDHLDPDIIILQEAKGTTYPQQFLAANADYEGVYSSGDGAHNRRMIMSIYDIIDASVREHPLGDGSLRTLFAATIDLPGAPDLEVFTAHWHASSATVRANESAASVALVRAYGAAHPGGWYLYAGDFNDVDTSSRITALVDPSVGLEMTAPVDPNNGSSATLNADPAVGTYLDRRVDYVLPSGTLAAFPVNGRLLNTWTYPPETIPPPLTLSDTVLASDHLPVYMSFMPEPATLILLGAGCLVVLRRANWPVGRVPPTHNSSRDHRHASG